MTAAQNSTFVSIARSGRRSRSSASAACSSSAADLVALGAQLLQVRRSTRARGSSARYTRWPKPISRSPRSRMDDTTLRASPTRSTSSIIGSTRAGAPPCSGPDIAPIAPDIAAATSAPVDAMTRAVNVDAFSPCSAADTQYASIALHVRRVRVATPAGHEALGDRRALVDPRLLDRGAADAARGLRHVGQCHHRRARELLARLGVVDVQQRLVVPDRARASPAPPARRPARRRCAPGSGTARPAGGPCRSGRRRAATTRRRTSLCRRGPRCSRPGNAARRRRGRVRRSRCGRRPRPPGPGRKPSSGLRHRRRVSIFRTALCMVSSLSRNSPNIARLSSCPGPVAILAWKSRVVSVTIKENDSESGVLRVRFRTRNARRPVVGLFHAPDPPGTRQAAGRDRGGRRAAAPRSAACG